MTPQERSLVTDLFDRLAALENTTRDAEAEQLIKDGLRRAPNAVYALVQSVLVQDEALKQADARIRELEDGLPEDDASRGQPRGFLDNMREALFGAEEGRRGSVPQVREGGQSMGVPPQYRTGQAPLGETQQVPQAGRSGGSFLGTAAAAAAGMIGGGLLLDGIRSMLGGDRSGAFAGTFDQLGGGDRSPWVSPESGGDLARQAGLEDIGQHRTSALDASDQGVGAGLFDAPAGEDQDVEFDEGAGDFDAGAGDQ